MLLLVVTRHKLNTAYVLVVGIPLLSLLACLHEPIIADTQAQFSFYKWIVVSARASVTGEKHSEGKLMLFHITSKAEHSPERTIK